MVSFSDRLARVTVYLLAFVVMALVLFYPSGVSYAASPGLDPLLGYQSAPLSSSTYQTATMPTPVTALVDSANVMANSFTTVGWVIAAVAIFVALGLGLTLAPRLLRLVRSSVGGGGGGKRRGRRR